MTAQTIGPVDGLIEPDLFHNEVADYLPFFKCDQMRPIEFMQLSVADATNVVDVKQTKLDNSMIPPRKSRISLLKIERPCEPDVEWGGIDWASVRF